MVALFPDSCALRLFEVVGKLPSGAIRSTPWGESLHPPGLNWSESLQRRGTSSRFVREFPDSCALQGLARNMQVLRGTSRAARSVATRHKGQEGDRSRAALRTSLRGFSFAFQLVFIPLKETLS